ncbi:MAG: nucleotidyltransferase [Streptococcus salivarius]
MKTSAIIEFKDTYASMKCHELGYQTKETALAIISPTGHILSSTPLFRKVYGSNTAHIDQLPFNIDNLSITARGLSKKAKANLEDWITHTIILPMDFDQSFTKHQELLHLLADSPIVESVQSLTYKTVKIHFSEALNDEHIRQLQGFILAQAGIYSYIGTSTVSDRNAHQALEWAKLDVNGRSHNDHKPAIFHRSKGLLGGFFHHGGQKSIA